MPSNEPDFLACSFLNIEPGKPVRYLPACSSQWLTGTFAFTDDGQLCIRTEENSLYLMKNDDLLSWK